MQNCKPVFRKSNKVYIKRPRLPHAPGSAAWLPALRLLARGQRREVEAVCRLLTKHSAGAQMLHYLLRWWKNKPSVRMTESDWQSALALSKKEIRFGKQSLEDAGVTVQVFAHKTGRATFYSLDFPRFITRLKTAIGATLGNILKALGVSPMGTDGSVQRGRMGLSNGDPTVFTESDTNHSHQTHDDDLLSSESDSGEIFFQEKESEDPQRDEHDASRRYLEEQGVKAPALAEVERMPLATLKRAFEVAEQHKASDKPAYALSVLKNGDFKPKPSWMRPDYKPVGSFGNSSAEKGLGAGANWSDFQTTPLPALPKLETQSLEEILVQRGIQLGGITQSSIPPEEAWNATYNQLELQLDRASFESWLRSAKFLGIDQQGRFIVSVANQYAEDMLQHRLYRNVRRTLTDTSSSPQEIIFVAVGQKAGVNV